jgi:uncharacterized protein
MAKFLLFVAVLAAIVMLMRASNRRRKPPPPASKPQAEPMAQCAHCGIHFPRTEALSVGGRDYCSEDHRRLGSRP